MKKNNEILILDELDRKVADSKIKKERDQQKVDKVINDLKKAASSEENLIPYIIEAVKAFASVGEICNTMRIVFGEYKEKVII